MVYLILLLSSISSFAQSIYSPENLKPVPHLKANERFQLQSEQPIQPKQDEKLKGEAADVGRNLQNNFAAIAEHLSPVPSCETRDAALHLEALRSAGQFKACLDFVKNCSNGHQGTYLFAASCASDLNQFVRADQLFSAGVKASSTEYIDMLIYQYASFAKFGIYPEKTAAIIALHPEWKTKINIVDGILELAAFGKTSKASKEDIDNFLNIQIVSKNTVTRALFLNVKLAILVKEYRYVEAKNFLVQSSSLMLQPYSSWLQAYNTFYSQSSTTYTAAREIYDRVLPYMHAESTLPLEQNTYNYTELYTSVCKDHLMQAQDYKDLSSIKSNWSNSALTNIQAINQLEQLNRSRPERADVLTMLGGLYRLENNVVLAKERYWQAHQACPYYNRAHWGLRLLIRKDKYESYPEFRQIERNVIETTPISIWPDHPENYFRNWRQFNEKFQQHVIYGARIWLPHFPFLIANQMTTYLKFDFELLSESPSLSHMRDKRIGGANYPNDNRLWDDVRGLGGDTVVSDIWETYYTAHGDYNLLGHEMAHQFQRASEEVQSTEFIVNCIVDLYREARQTNNFPDAYSAQNKEEHFAQGVTYYLVPKDSPPRFGLNQNWVEQNNPRQFRFVKSIDVNNGDLSKISCL